MPPSKAQLKFQADFKSATEKNDEYISTIQKGDADDEITFVFTHSKLPTPTHIEIRVQLQSMGGYPDENTFLIYTNNDIPPAVAGVLEESLSETAGMRVQDMLKHITKRLRVTLESNDSKGKNLDMVDDAESSRLYTSSDEDYSPYEYSDDLGDDLFGDGKSSTKRKCQFSKPLTPELQKRIHQDLQAVAKAGFHAGKVCGFESDAYEGIVSISIRVTKLCLLRETHEAWGLSSSDFVVLLIKFDPSYITIEDILRGQVGPADMEFRLRKCSRKKPSLKQAQRTFMTGAATEPTEGVSQDTDLSIFWVSKSIDELMDKYFANMLKLRKEHGITWDIAREIGRAYETKSFSQKQPSPTDYTELEDGEEASTAEVQLPPILSDDHMLADGEISLPLVAMQFALRYLVKCTDYCAVCHRRMKGDFRALRPYVCSKPLCLHQYINIGLGPNIEYEIISQPNVVDLLIGFCYSSLLSSLNERTIAMREFPTGLNLQVPRILGRHSTPYSTVRRGISDNVEPHVIPISGGYLVDPLDVTFNWVNSTAIISRKSNGITLEKGQWVIISTEVLNGGTQRMTVLHHARITSRNDVLLELDVMVRCTLPNGSIDNPVGFGCVEESVLKFPGENIKGHLVFCDGDLDSLAYQLDKAFSMLVIICSFPPVAKMRQYLLGNQQLFKWGRMSRAAIDLLRWTIASNRSYIVQVDDDDSPTSASIHKSPRIRGVNGWIQFRFAQGSPEQETQFNEVLESIDKPQKSLVAWHGSPLRNWHSIIRQGLDYRTVSHGRSYGDGIYFARSFDQSVSYSGISSILHMPNMFSTVQSTTFSWPNSSLGVRAVVSLNELVNQPDMFRSTNPYFVVQHCHWTRCRYLFVLPSKKHDDEEDKFLPNPQLVEIDSDEIPVGVSEFVQDPKWCTTGPKNRPLFIPDCAIPSARGRCDSPTGPPADNKEKPKDSETITSDEEGEDILFLSHEYELSGTGFRPGTLDYSTLPQLAPPSYATNTAQRALAQEIRKLEKVQSTTPLYELGWYINFEKITNMFQWVVELHSFSPDLPLAQDMKEAGLTSIILEMHFFREFPISPPFVRVVRPRFLPFISGGGGHVTAGGAMCMELLTNTGWSPANSLESVLLQVRLAICNTDPQPARLERKKARQIDYSISEAVDAYIRAATAHGWDIPGDLREASASGFI
ncbi:hypothetical protein F5Y11DRAFT_69602 [Daldinia sp. FL1419]|nr:hypothetical protein F5Y11DRAFT_69602 [Daldinia sp. FL1419]